MIYSDQWIAMSWIRRIKKGNQIYLYECTSVWENGKTKSKMLRYLGVESDEIKVPKPISKRISKDRIYPDRSVQAGDVTLLWKIAEQLDIINVIDRYCMGLDHINGPSPGKYVTIWAINRIIDPESATQLDSWVRCTTLPDLAGMEGEDFSKDTFLRSLDSLCNEIKKSKRIMSHIPAIEDQLYQNWRRINPIHNQLPETIAFDLTAIPTFGETCPLSELGSKSRITHQNQINLSILASKFDTYPIFQFIHPGSFHSISTVNDLIVRLKEFQITDATIVWDRGYTSKNEIQKIEKQGWNLICGVTKRSKSVKELVAKIDPPIDPDHLVPTQEMNIYAVKVQNSIFKTNGSVVIYLNVDRRLKQIQTRNITLKQISLDLDELKITCSKLNPNDLNERIKKIIGSKYYEFVQYSVNSENSKVSFDYHLNIQARIDAEQMDGKYILYSSDYSLSALDVVRIYFEKDYIEKVFRNLKSFEEIGPIRHRLETRVTAILFICTLALRLKVVLRTFLLRLNKKPDISAEMLLKKLARVQKVELWVDNSKESWYVNMQKKTLSILEDMGFETIFEGKIRAP